jgi:hypothetical protein
MRKSLYYSRQVGCFFFPALPFLSCLVLETTLDIFVGISYKLMHSEALECKVSLFHI